MQLSVIQASEILKVSEDTLYQWIRNNGLPATRFGNRYRISRIKLIEWAHLHGIPMQVEGDRDEPWLRQALLSGKLISNLEYRGDLDSLLTSFLWAACPESAAQIAPYLRIRERSGFIPHATGVLVPAVDFPIIIPGTSAAVHIARLAPCFELEGNKFFAVLMIISPSVGMHASLLTRLLAALSDKTFVSLLEAGRDAQKLDERLQELGAAWKALVRQETREPRLN